MVAHLDCGGLWVADWASLSSFSAITPNKEQQERLKKNEKLEEVTLFSLSFFSLRIALMNEIEENGVVYIGNSVVKLS